MPIFTSGSPLSTFEEIIAETTKNGAGWIESRFPHAVLVVQAPMEARGPALAATTVGDSDHREPNPAAIVLTPVVVSVCLCTRSAGAQKIVVGSGDDSDVILPFPSVSKAHALLASKDVAGTWGIEDAGSTNGTFVDAVQCRQGSQRPLRDGAELRFGNVLATFWLGATFRDSVKRRAGIG